MKLKNIVVLVSGGVDSFIAYHFVKKMMLDIESITPLFIDYGGRYTNKERTHVLSLFPDLVIDNSTLFLRDHEIGEKAFIQNRNIYLALIASRYGDGICMAGLKDDRVGDKSPGAFAAMSTVLTECNDNHYLVFSPFFGMEKVEVIEWYLNEGLPEKDLHKTISCYADDDAHFCGECPACYRKFCAFTYHDLYIPEFTNLELATKYLAEYKDKDSKRALSVLKASKKLGLI